MEKTYYSFSLVFLLATVNVSISLVFQAREGNLVASLNDLVTLQLNFTGEPVTINDDNLTCFFKQDDITLDLGNWTSTTLTVNPDISNYLNVKLSGSFIDNRVSIKIDRTTFSSSGQYACRYKSQEVTISLDVKGKPVVKKESLPTDLKADVNNIFCLVACGNPRPKVRWMILQIDEESKEMPVTNLSSITEDVRSLRGSCYKYSFTLRLNESCLGKTELHYIIKNEEGEINQNHSVYFPEPRLTNVVFQRDNKCQIVTWDAPVARPGFCNNPTLYMIRFTLSNMSKINFTSYSTRFQICITENIDISQISSVEVGFVKRDKVVNFKTALEGTKPVTNKNTVIKENDKLLVIILGSILGLLLLILIIFAVAIFIKKNSIFYDNNNTSSSKIRKDTIVHRPRSLSQVGNKFPHSGGNTPVVNEYTESPSLRKEILPMNTIGKRIAERLLNQNESFNSQILTENEIHINRYTDPNDDSERPVSTHTEVSYISNSPAINHRNLIRMDSRVSVKSEYGLPRARSVITGKSFDEPAIIRPQSDMYLPRAIQRNIRANMPSYDTQNGEVIYANSRPTSRRASIASDYQGKEVIYANSRPTSRKGSISSEVSLDIVLPPKRNSYIDFSIVVGNSYDRAHYDEPSCSTFTSDVQENPYDIPRNIIPVRKTSTCESVTSEAEDKQNNIQIDYTENEDRTNLGGKPEYELLTKYSKDLVAEV